MLYNRNKEGKEGGKMGRGEEKVRGEGENTCKQYDLGDCA
jgi:hypothetical protein